MPATTGSLLLLTGAAPADAAAWGPLLVQGMGWASSIVLGPRGETPVPASWRM